MWSCVIVATGNTSAVASSTTAEFQRDFGGSWWCPTAVTGYSGRTNSLFSWYKNLWIKSSWLVCSGGDWKSSSSSIWGLISLPGGKKIHKNSDCINIYLWYKWQNNSANGIFTAERLSNKGRKMSTQVKTNLIKQIKTIHWHWNIILTLWLQLTEARKFSAKCSLSPLKSTHFA